MFLINFAKWSALFTTSLIFDILGVIIIPIALLFAKESDDHLPSIFWPWDNDRDGINGDGETGISGWRGPEHANGLERTFWYRYVWLAFRNPSNNYGYFCGIEPKGDFSVIGNEDFGITQSTGCVFVTCDNGWCFYLVLPYGFGKGIRIAAGWKFWDRTRTLAQIVLVVNPVFNV